VRAPTVPIRSHELTPEANELSRLIRRFNREVTRALFRHREAILEMQYVQERFAAAAMELVASACVLSRRDAELQAAGPGSATNGSWRQSDVAHLFLRQSFRRIRQAFADLHDNDDGDVTATADAVLRRGREQSS